MLLSILQKSSFRKQYFKNYILITDEIQTKKLTSNFIYISLEFMLCDFHLQLIL